MNIIGMSNVSFLTKNIQYTTLKLNFVKVIQGVLFTMSLSLKKVAVYI